MSNSPSHIPPPYYEEDEVTLKHIILTVQEYSKEVFKHIHWLLLGVLLITGFTYYFFKPKATTYTSGLSFLIKKQAGQKQQNTISPELLRLGIGGSLEDNKLRELARSSLVINKILLEKITLNGKSDFFANHLIDIYGYHHIWNNEPIGEEYQELKLNDFHFENNDVNSFSQKQHRALNILRELIVGNNIAKTSGILSVVYDKSSEITRLETTTLNGNASMQLINLVFEELKKLYIEETVGRSKRNYDLLAAKVDSLFNELKSKQRQLAKATDQTYALVSKADFLRQGQLERDVERTNEVYLNLLSKKQDVEFNITTETPEFMVIDRTFIPIENKTAWWKPILVAIIAGFFLGLGVIVLRKIIRDALAT